MVRLPKNPARAVLAVLVATAFAQPALASNVRNFFSPEVKGARIDACLAGGGCGKPAADAFCRAQGYDHAMIFQRESFASTRTIDSGKVCSEGCTAFRQVKCITAKSDLAGL
jgi:hypothetical protein